MKKKTKRSHLAASAAARREVAIETKTYNLYRPTVFVDRKKQARKNACRVSCDL